MITLSINEDLGSTPPGASYKTYVEPVSRPAVKMSPRTGYVNQSMVITVTVYSDDPPDENTASWQVGSSEIPARAPTTMVPQTGPGPYVSTWSVTAGDLGLHDGSSPILVTFSVREKKVQPNVTYVVGVNECWF